MTPKPMTGTRICIGDNGQVSITTGIEWAEVLIENHDTGEIYEGWAPYGALIAYQHGHIGWQDVVRAMRTELPPELATKRIRMPTVSVPRLGQD